MGLDSCSKIEFTKYLLIKWIYLDKILCYHIHLQDLGLDNNISFFMNFEPSYCPDVKIDFSSRCISSNKR